MSLPVEHLALVLSRACSASCAHCGSSAGPGRRQWMDAALARCVIDGAAAHGVVEVTFTGGEPLLHRKLTLRCIRRASGNGLRTVVCSNGFWARDDTLAAGWVAALRDAGLRRLQLSTDRWHLPFVAADCVERAAVAAVRAGLETQVAIPAGRHDWVAMELLARFGALDGVDAFTHPAHPVGRGEHLPPHHLQHLPPRSGGCGIAGHVEVDWDGSVSICPVSADFGPSSRLRLGDAGEEPIGALLDRYRSTPLHRVIEERGPVALARLAGEPDPVDRHDCHLCRRLHTDPQVAARLRQRLGVDLDRPMDERAAADALAAVRAALEEPVGAGGAPPGTRVALRARA